MSTLRLYFFIPSTYCFAGAEKNVNFLMKRRIILLLSHKK